MGNHAGCPQVGGSGDPSCDLAQPPRLIRQAAARTSKACDHRCKIGREISSLPGDYTRIVVGDPIPGWTSYELAFNESINFHPDRLNRPMTHFSCTLHPVRQQFPS